MKIYAAQFNLIGVDDEREFETLSLHRTRTGAKMAAGKHKKVMVEKHGELPGMIWRVKEYEVMED